jgi:hypothetical protein
LGIEGLLDAVGRGRVHHGEGGRVRHQRAERNEELTAEGRIIRFK